MKKPLSEMSEAELKEETRRTIEEGKLLDEKTKRLERDPLYMPFNDGGNMERIYTWLKFDYVHTEAGWRRWNGKYWEDNAQGKLYLDVVDKFQALRDLSKEAESEAVSDKDLKLAAERTKYFNQCCNVARINAAIELAKERFARKEKEFDANPDLLNFENGTVDLRTGELRPHDRRDLITKTTRYAIDKDGQCLTFKKLIFDAMGQNDENGLFLLQCLGSALSGCVKDQIILLNHGAGSNGKSTLFDYVMLRVMGDYGKAINIKSFLDTHASRQIGPRPDLVSLRGVRYGTMSEPPTNSNLDEALIKSFTGGDKVTYRDLHKGDVEFLPTLHLFMSYNVEPTIKDFSYGMVRRLKKLEWPVIFQKDEAFKSALDAEIPSIAWFLVQTCKDWYANGLVVPGDVTAATQDYLFDENPVAQFVDKYLSIHDSFSSSNSDIWMAWEQACKAEGWDVQSKRYVSSQLKSLGFRQVGGRSNGRKWDRIAILWDTFGTDKKDTESD